MLSNNDISEFEKEANALRETKNKLNNKLINETDSVLKISNIKEADKLKQEMINLKQRIYKEFNTNTSNKTKLAKILNELNQNIDWSYDIPKYNDERSAYLDALTKLMPQEYTIDEAFILKVGEEVELIRNKHVSNEHDIETIIQIRRLLEKYKEQSLDEKSIIDELKDLKIPGEDNKRIENAENIIRENALCSMFYYYEDFEKLAQAESDKKKTVLFMDMSKVKSIEYDSIGLHDPEASSNVPLTQQSFVGRKEITIPLNSVLRVNFKNGTSLDFGPKGSVYLPVPSQELFNKPKNEKDRLNYKNFLEKEDHFIEYLLERFENEKINNPNANITLNLNAIPGDTFREEYRDRVVKKLFEKYGATTSQQGALNERAFELNAALVRGGVLMESEGFKIMNSVKKPDSMKRSQELKKEALNDFLKEIQSPKIKSLKYFLLNKEKETEGQLKYLYAKEASNIVSYTAFSSAQLLYNVASFINSGTTIDYSGSYGNIFKQSGLNKNFKDSFQHRLIQLLTSNNVNLDKELNTLTKECGLKKEDAETFKQKFKDLYHSLGDSFRDDFQKERKAQQLSSRIKKYLFGDSAQSKQSNTEGSNASSSPGSSP